QFLSPGIRNKMTTINFGQVTRNPTLVSVTPRVARRPHSQRRLAGHRQEITPARIDPSTFKNVPKRADGSTALVAVVKQSFSKDKASGQSSKHQTHAQQKKKQHVHPWRLVVPQSRSRCRLPQRFRPLVRVLFQKRQTSLNLLLHQERSSSLIRVAWPQSTSRNPF